MENDIKVHIGIDSIKDHQFSISKSFPEQLNPQELELRYLVETEIVRSRERVKVLTGVNYMLREDSLCELVISTSFSINPFSEIITVDDTKKTVSFMVEVIPTLLNIAFGVLRGALFEKTKGTSLDAYPLPLISMQELVEINRFKVEKTGD